MFDTMKITANLDTKMNIRTIVWPIFLESLVRMSLMTVDIFMLARYSDDAVAAVGLTGHFIFFLMLTYMVVSSGSAILIGQNLGAKQYERAQRYAQSGFFLAVVVSVAVSLLFLVGARFFVGLYGLEPQVANYAVQYATVVGSLSIGMALSILFSTVLRAHGYSKSPMTIQMMAGLINVVGNYIALFPPLGLPVTGVVGVAVATVTSQIAASIACLVLIKRHGIDFSIRQSFKPEVVHLKSILKLGIPNAGEGLSYNFAQLTILFFVAQLGTAALAAAAIAQTLSRFMFVFAMSVGNGTQILSSYFVGQGRQSELKARVHKYWVIGVSVSLSVALVMMLARFPIAGFFSDDLATQKLIALLIIVSVFLEPGRAINLIVIQALKGAGDVVFPVKMGILSMWGIGVLFAYLLGIQFALGVAGIWVGVAMDEWVRGIIMIIRWQKEKWVGMKRT